MGFSRIEVKIVKATKSKVTLLYLSSNSRLSMKIEEFRERQKEGIYQLVNPDQFNAIEGLK